MPTMRSDMLASGSISILCTKTASAVAPRTPIATLHAIVNIVSVTSKPNTEVVPELKLERSRATFNVRHMTYLWNGGERLTQLIERIRSLVAKGVEEGAEIVDPVSLGVRPGVM